MLRPAQLYKEEINRKFMGIWYDTDYMYYSFDPGLAIFDPADTNQENHSFVSVDKDDHIVGIINYSVNWQTMSASSFGIMAFEKFNLTFGKDLHQAIEDIFFKYNLNRLQFWAVADNPAVKSYRRFIQRYGGTQNAYEHESCKLIDGKLHDAVAFELMARDFKSRYVKKEN